MAATNAPLAGKGAERRNGFPVCNCGRRKCRADRAAARKAFRAPSKRAAQREIRAQLAA